MRNGSLEWIALCLGANVAGDVGGAIGGYAIDSRKVERGDLFFALPGERTDGHRFLKEAAAAGAQAAVVREGYEGESYGLTLLRVGDVAEGLRSLARASLEEKRPFVVGITGSVGKTTCKEFTAALLAGKWRVSKPEGSYNTQLTVPLTILNREWEAEVLVLEMGMSAPGGIRRLLEVVEPDLAVLTKVALAHAEHFGDGLEGIAREKGTIFQGARTKTKVFDAAFLGYEAAREVGEKRVSFSIEAPSADYWLFPWEGKWAVDERGVRACALDLPFQESHLVHNLLAAMAVAREMGMGWHEIEARLGGLQLPKMRFEQIAKGGVLFVNDAYNANPASMRAALCHIPQPQEGGKRIGVLGAMRELGQFSEEAHAEVGRLAQKCVDCLFVLGKEAKGMAEAFAESKKPMEYCESHAELVEKLKGVLRPGDVVLLKGSRSLEMERVLELI
jgi:UDP-N-acetylmuramoyl-tripeptide--D-alanyl-D-alanine ligase